MGRGSALGSQPMCARNGAQLLNFARAEGGRLSKIHHSAPSRVRLSKIKPDEIERKMTQLCRLIPVAAPGGHIDSALICSAIRCGDAMAGGLSGIGPTNRARLLLLLGGL